MPPQGAPIFTHAVMSAICWAVSFCFGGICESGSPQLIALISRLLSGLPGTIAAPLLPPFSIPSRLSSSSLPLSYSALAEWHW